MVMHCFSFPPVWCRAQQTWRQTEPSQVDLQLWIHGSGQSLAASHLVPLPLKPMVPLRCPLRQRAQAGMSNVGWTCLSRGLVPTACKWQESPEPPRMPSLVIFRPRNTYLLHAENYFQVLIHAKGIRRFWWLSRTAHPGDRSSVPAAVSASTPSSPSQQTLGWWWRRSLLGGLLSHSPTVHSQTSSRSGHTTQHEVGVGVQASLKPPTKDWFSAGPTPPAPQHRGKQQHGEREGGCQQQLPQTYGDAQGTSHFKHRWTG